MPWPNRFWLRQGWSDSVDGSPLLAQIAELLKRHGLEAILIGNAAAALQGAPVTTVDLDFLFRKTPLNLKKLKTIASELDAVILRPYYPTSGLFRVMRDRDGLQLDFMTDIHGVAAFEGLRKRPNAVRFGDAELMVAALADIIKSKRAAGRPEDLAVLRLLEKTLEEASRKQKDAPRSSQERE
jgi:predicted nucleotidyltransferase